jgi:hypothetical protein
MIDLERLFRKPAAQFRQEMVVTGTGVLFPSGVA